MQLRVAGRCSVFWYRIQVASRRKNKVCKMPQVLEFETRNRRRKRGDHRGGVNVCSEHRRACWSLSMGPACGTGGATSRVLSMCSAARVPATLWKRRLGNVNKLAQQALLRAGWWSITSTCAPSICAVSLNRLAPMLWHAHAHEWECLDLAVDLHSRPSSGVTNARVALLRLACLPLFSGLCKSDTGRPAIIPDANDLEHVATL
jgi:hypothetical protein